MGQKVNPNGLRLGINKNWDARWYASNKEVPNLLDEDLKIRKYVAKKFQSASIARVITERSKNRVVVTLYTAKPGMVIGREGAIKKEAVEELSTPKEIIEDEDVITCTFTVTGTKEQIKQIEFRIGD